MSLTTQRRARIGLFVCVLPVLAGAAACNGVAPDAVRGTTSAIAAQASLAKASLVPCRGGDRAQCDSAEQNLEAVVSSNAELSKLAVE
jgi:hypothetical protein